MSNLQDLNELQVVMRTLYGEARGQQLTGIEAVAHVIVNRARSPVSWWGNTPRSVCLRAWQFSCWNMNDPNRAILLAVSLDQLRRSNALSMAWQVLAGQLLDNTHGSLHYFNPKIANPRWARGLEPTVVIGDHAFYNNVR